MYMGTSAPFTFRILKISKSHTSMSPKIMMLKYISRYLQEECIQKIPLKIHCILENIKRQISDSKY
jgi:hypothetical protein